jgi:hypothetical protein
MCLIIAACGATSRTPVVDQNEDASMADRCFDGEAATRLGSVTLEYETSPPGSMEIRYQTDGEPGEQQLAVRVASSASAMSYATLQELTFAVASLASRSVRVTANEREIADLVSSDGLISGRAMVVGGEVVDVESYVDSGTLLPGAARALLPFLRMDECRRAVLPSFYPPYQLYDTVIEIGEALIVDAPAGRFDAIQVFIDGRHGRDTYLVRAEAPHFILRSISPDSLVTTELSRISEASDR